VNKFLTKIKNMKGENKIMEEAGSGLFTQQQDLSGLTKLADSQALRLLNAKEPASIYRNLVELSIDMIFTVDLEGNFLFVNPAFEKNLGYSIKEVKNLNGFSLVHPEDLPKAKEQFLKLINGENVNNLEYRYKKKDGSYINILNNAAPLFDANKKVVAALGIAHDITALKKIEEELRKTQGGLMKQVENQTIELRKSNELLNLEINERKRINELLLQKAEDLLLINTLNTAVNLGDSLSEIFRLLIDETSQLFSCNGTTIYLLSKDKKFLAMQNFNLPSEIARRIEKLTGMKLPEIKIPLKEHSIYLKLINNGEPELFNDPERIQDLMVEFTENEMLKKLIPRIIQMLNIQSVLSIPLVLGNDVIGLLEISRKQPFTESDKNRLESLAEYMTAIIERKRTEDAVREGEEKYRTIFEGSRDAIYVTTREGQLVNANEALVNLFGYSRNEITSLNVQELYVNPEARKKYQQEIETKGFVKDFELRLRKKDGTELDCRLTSTIRHDNDGTILGYQGIIHDFTEHKRIEQEIRNINEQLEKRLREKTTELKLTYGQLKSALEQFYQAQKVESIGMLAGGIAHDFNNLLAVILGNISLAKMVINSKDKVFNIISRAEKASLQAKDLTQQLMSFAQTGSTNKKPVSAVKIIKDATTLALSGTKIKCDFSLPDQLHQVEVDERQLIQAISNIIINSEKLLKEGGIIKLSAENITINETANLPLENGIYLKITLKLQGRYPSQEKTDPLTGPLQVSKLDSLGFGFKIAYSIIKEYGGHITLDSQPETGTAYDIYLPAYLKETQATGHTSKEVAKEPIDQGKILVLDDEAKVREMVELILSRYGLKSGDGCDGKELINFYQKVQDLRKLLIP
jgi:PAS domain S-box-containing protein